VDHNYTAGSRRAIAANRPLRGGEAMTSCPEFPELEAKSPVLAGKLSRLPPERLATVLPPRPSKDTDARM
jgi:hypothetical protein